LTTDLTNQRAYQSPMLARSYAQQTQLQPPEETILEIVRDELPSKRMLDVGVGGGRTTERFAALVQEYIGIDYSEAMVTACRERFAARLDSLQFRLADISSMPFFSNASFDFVLFSYNGIDYLSRDSRRKALAEIHRVLREGAYFAFSSHNLNNLRYRLRWIFEPKHPRASISRLLWILKFWRHNPAVRNLRALRSIEVIDGALNYTLKTRYQEPQAQLEELLEMGFRNIRAFRLADGREISREDLQTNREDWVYYLCSR
jgi:ubiquinone/menaquinone biosynthesis C-methylase UbiE